MTDSAGRCTRENVFDKRGFVVLANAHEDCSSNEEKYILRGDYRCLFAFWLKIANSINSDGIDYDENDDYDDDEDDDDSLEMPPFKKIDPFLTKFQGIVELYKASKAKIDRTKKAGLPLDKLNDI
ncbi:MAG: hypothetical protein U5L45_01775 [Saprospiraceae bacterium]|nr:hypothetical protein [Saprospiraceae bacterium]